MWVKRELVNSIAVKMIDQSVFHLIRHEIIHRFTRFIYDIPDLGTGECIRNYRADKPDFQSAGFNNPPGLKYRLAV